MTWPGKESTNFGIYGKFATGCLCGLEQLFWLLWDSASSHTKRTTGIQPRWLVWGLRDLQEPSRYPGIMAVMLLLSKHCQFYRSCFLYFMTAYFTSDFPQYSSGKGKCLISSSLHHSSYRGPVKKKHSLNIFGRKERKKEGKNELLRRVIKWLKAFTLESNWISNLNTATHQLPDFGAGYSTFICRKKITISTSKSCDKGYKINFAESLA